MKTIAADERAHPGFLQASQFCDSENPIVIRAAANITENCGSLREKARTLFYWVRDSIRYDVGIRSEKASCTLTAGRGSCSHKANLLVAMLRSLGIPAGFHVMEVKGKEYFGALCVDRFSALLSERSVHAYAAVQLDGNWIRVDPTDDIQLSNGVRHLCIQASPVSFDGHSDALLMLERRHILSDTAEPLPDIDHMLSKRRRVPDDVIDVFNIWLDFLRCQGVCFESPQAVERSFFDWLGKAFPEKHGTYFTFLSQAMARMTADQPVAQADPKPNTLTRE